MLQKEKVIVLVALFMFFACNTQVQKDEKVLDASATISEEKPVDLKIDEKLFGTWLLTGVSIINAADTTNQTPEEAHMDLVSTNNDDGTFKDVFNGQEMKGTWVAEGDHLLCSYEDGSERAYTYQFVDENVSMTMDMGETKMVFHFKPQN